MIGLFIHPPFLPSHGQLQAPENWEPTVYDPCEFVLPVPAPVAAEPLEHNQSPEGMDIYAMKKVEVADPSPGIMTKDTSQKHLVNNAQYYELQEEEEGFAEGED